MLPLPENRAYCQPNPELRDRLLTDLDIKGLNACPDKVDIEAVRLVYDMSDPTKFILRTVQPALAFDISGVVNPRDIIIYGCDNIGTRIQFEELLMLFTQINFDVAGRAALVAANAEVRIHIRFADTISAVYIEVGNSAWLPVAAALTDLNCVGGTHIRSLGAAVSAFPAANLFEMVLPSPIKFRHTAGGMLVCTFEITNMIGGFPANTWATVNAIYSFK